MSITASIDLGCDLADVARARHWLRDNLAGSHPDVSSEIAADAEVVISELVTNSVRASCTVVHVDLDRDPDCLRLGVTDDAPGLPVVRAADPTDLTGRGLPIVNALTSQWGVRSTPVGKETWALFTL